MRLPLFMLVLACACTERRLFIETDPPGATVRVDGRELGRSPAEWRFDHYGKVLVEVELDRYESMQEVVELKAPAREWILGGFFTDVIWPGTVRDDHHVTLKLKRLKKKSETQIKREISGLQRRALRLRSEAQRQ